jgi:hypothetical protein
LIWRAAQHRLEALSSPYLAASVAMKAMALVLRSVPLQQQQQQQQLSHVLPAAGTAQLAPTVRHGKSCSIDEAAVCCVHAPWLGPKETLPTGRLLLLPAQRTSRCSKPSPLVCSTLSSTVGWGTCCWCSAGQQQQQQQQQQQRLACAGRSKRACPNSRFIW